MSDPRVRAVQLLLAEKQSIEQFMDALWEVLVEIDEINPQLTAHMGALIERGATPFLAQIFDLLKDDALCVQVLNTREYTENESVSCSRGRTVKSIPQQSLRSCGG